VIPARVIHPLEKVTTSLRARLSSPLLLTPFPFLPIAHAGGNPSNGRQPHEALVLGRTLPGSFHRAALIRGNRLAFRRGLAGSPVLPIVHYAEDLIVLHRSRSKVSEANPEVRDSGRSTRFRFSNTRILLPPGLTGITSSREPGPYRPVQPTSPCLQEGLRPAVSERRLPVFLYLEYPTRRVPTLLSYPTEPQLENAWGPKRDPYRCADHVITDPFSRPPPAGPRLIS